MPLPSVETARQADRQKLIQLITLGFSADPAMRWMWPDLEAYAEHMPRFVTAMGGDAFEHRTAWYADDYRAAALWLPPDVEPDSEALGALIDTLPPENAEDAASVMQQMAEYHPHDRPCWYLPLMAADPAYTGRGLGSALMKHALRRCDEAGQMAYLESSNPRNISLSERHGFEVIGKIQAGTSPVIRPMVREARP